MTKMKLIQPTRPPKMPNRALLLANRANSRNSRFQVLNYFVDKKESEKGFAMRRGKRFGGPGAQKIEKRLEKKVAREFRIRALK